MNYIGELFVKSCFKVLSKTNAREYASPEIIGINFIYDKAIVVQTMLKIIYWCPILYQKKWFIGQCSSKWNFHNRSKVLYRATPTQYAEEKAPELKTSDKKNAKLR